MLAHYNIKESSLPKKNKRIKSKKKLMTESISKIKLNDHKCRFTY